MSDVNAANVANDGQDSRRVVLITGANQGIGYQVAKRIAQDYHPSTHVLMGCRDLIRGEEAALSLKQQGLSVEALFVDVTDDVSILEAAEHVSATYGRLDVLINNAGISNDGSLGQPGVSERKIFQKQFNTNLFGAMQVTETFTPLLDKSQSPRLVFTSSRLGSLTQRTDPEDPYYSAMLPAYRTSKAALNMLCLHYAVKHRQSSGGRWKVNAVEPGHVATNLNGFRGPEPVESGATEIVRMAMLGADGPTGTFSSNAGIVPW